MSKFYSAEYLSERLCLRSGDTFMRNKGRYLDVAKDVWEDMNEDVLKIGNRVKIPTRWEFYVDKRTNTVTVPRNVGKLCSVSGVDKWGRYYPLYLNNEIPIDIVDIGASHDCACENECSYALCNTIKGYEAVTSVKSDYLPDGTAISFTCVDRKMVDKQGFFYSQTQYPQRVYTSGVWTDTILYTNDEKLCKLEVDEKGCVCDTDENLTKVCQGCGIENNPSCLPLGGTASVPPTCDSDANTWIYWKGSTMEWFNTQCGDYPYSLYGGFNNIYNISQEGNRIILPYNFGFDKVMIRFYEDIDINNIQVPSLAANCFMTGLKFFSTEFNTNLKKLSIEYGREYSAKKWSLLIDFNKNTIAENAKIYVKKTYMPSYIIDYRNQRD